MAYSNEGAILASDGILVLNDAGQTVFAISDSGSLDGNYTFYQMPVDYQYSNWNSVVSTDGVYTHRSYPDSGTVFYAFDGAGGYSEQAVSFDNESLNSIFSTESVGTPVNLMMHLRFLLCIRMVARSE